MPLNPACPRPGVSTLFVREGVTAAVGGVLLGVPDQIAAQLRMLGGRLPDVPIGEHCTKPYDCPFLDRCWKLPQHHVSTLYRIERRKVRSEEHTSELQSRLHLVCRLLLEKKKKIKKEEKLM